MDRDTAPRTLTALLPRLREEFGVVWAGLFGSTARGRAGPESDVDVLVELARPLSYFDIQRLEDVVQEAMGQPVDVHPRGHVRPHVLKSIEHDLIRA